MEELKAMDDLPSVNDLIGGVEFNFFSTNATTTCTTTTPASANTEEKKEAPLPTSVIENDDFMLMLASMEKTLAEVSNFSTKIESKHGVTTNEKHNFVMT